MNDNVVDLTAYVHNIDTNAGKCVGLSLKLLTEGVPGQQYIVNLQSS